MAEITISQGVAALGALAGVLVLLADDHATLSIVGSTGYSKEQREPWRQIRLDTLTPLTEAMRLGAPTWIESQAELSAEFPEDGGTRFVVVLPIAPPDRKEDSEPW